MRGHKPKLIPDRGALLATIKTLADPILCTGGWSRAKMSRPTGQRHGSKILNTASDGSWEAAIQNLVLAHAPVSHHQTALMAKLGCKKVWRRVLPLGTPR
jgi:hypothetical protein